MTSSKTHAVVTTACIAIAIASMLPIGSRDARAQNPGSAKMTLVAPLPLPVTDLDAASREPVQFSNAGSFTQAGAGSVDLVIVPAGKRLVIEHVSGWVNETSGVGLSSCNLMVGSETTAFLVCQPMGKNDLNNVYAANAQTKVYADAGQLVRFTALTLPGGASGALRGFASGYYVPAP